MTDIALACASIREKAVTVPLHPAYNCPCESGFSFARCHGRVDGEIGGVPAAEFYPEFRPFGKIARWNRNVVITEKIDGTNAQIYFDEKGRMFAGSRNRWLTPDHDNYGFAKWAYEHEDELRGLGQGHHFGEWYGQGIQRRYGLDHKRFALFNTGRWNKNANDLTRVPPPACCSVVPVLYEGPMDQFRIDGAMRELHERGSHAVPGFMKPEGVVIFHCASSKLYKITLEGDEKPKGRTE